MVSGLPRSGTSLMMQMLAAGGLSLLCDGRRPPDEDNPRGYFELEAARRLPEDAGWLEGAAGRAVKIVAPLLPGLRTDQGYRVIFMERDLDEVIASQDAMLERRGREADPLAPEALRRVYAGQLREAKGWLAAQPRVSTLFVVYREVLDAPEGAAAAVDRFLGGGLDVAAMARAVEPSLHRQQR